jgi:hypothetical protein
MITLLFIKFSQSLFPMCVKIGIPYIVQIESELRQLT